MIDAAAWAGSRMPVRAAHRAAAVGGTIEWAVRPGKRAVLASNIAHAVGRRVDDPLVRATARREFRNEAHRSADLLWALGSPDEFLASVEVLGSEHAREAADRGNGVILAGLHVGGWEVAARVPSVVVPVPTTVLVADDWLAWAIEHMRVAAGLRIMYRTAPATQMARVLRNGGALLVLGDDAWGSRPRTHTVKLLDADADLPAGIVALSRLCQAPIVNFAVLPLAPRRWQVQIDPVVEPPVRTGGAEAEQKTLQVLADRWTETLRAHPDQWAASFPINWRARP